MLSSKGCTRSRKAFFKCSRGVLVAKSKTFWFNAFRQSFVKQTAAGFLVQSATLHTHPDITGLYIDVSHATQGCQKSLKM